MSQTIPPARREALASERRHLVSESERLAVFLTDPDLSDDVLQTLIEELRAVRLRIHAIDLVLKKDA